MNRKDVPFDPVERPKHYNSHPSGVECIALAQYYSFSLGNTIKYMWRAGLKATEPDLQDLKKAEWYLKHAIGERASRHYSVKGTPHWSGLVSSVVPHHNAEIAGAIRHITEAEQTDELRLAETLLNLALRELQHEILKIEQRAEKTGT